LVVGTGVVQRENDVAVSATGNAMMARVVDETVAAQLLCQPMPSSVSVRQPNTFEAEVGDKKAVVGQP